MERDGVRGDSVRCGSGEGVMERDSVMERG